MRCRPWSRARPLARRRTTGSLVELVAAGDRSGAVKHLIRNSMGIPAPFVALMQLMPMWKGLKATAHTLPYDWAALGNHNITAPR